MKYRIFFILNLLLLFNVECDGGNDNNRSPFSSLHFKNEMIDVGKISNKKEDVSTCFEFVNDGCYSVKITKAITACSCTKVTFPPDKISPKEKGKIKVVIKRSYLYGRFYKTIKLQCDDGMIYTLRVKGQTI